MQPEIAVVRFGLGARPGELAAAAEPSAWLRAQLHGPVMSAANVSPLPSQQILAAVLEARRRRHDGADQEAGTTAREIYRPCYREQVLARAQSAVSTPQPFAERLVHFWSNHFAVSADKGVVYGLAGSLENEAIRPHVNGRFVDMLTAVERHPAMLAFLDNQYSVGADSEFAQRRALRPGASARRLGINENLAREILELHTLGVSGGYRQADVTSFAQVLTGWSIGGGTGQLAGGTPGAFYFRERLHEPGAKTVLGKVYREDGATQGDAVLADLARHPSTARFLATKLARHFIADAPPPAVVARLAKVYLRSDGDLPQVYGALIDSPEAWNATLQKYKTPQDFVYSTLRSLEVLPEHSEEVMQTFELLGQRQYAPGSPAGWPDTAANWDGADALMRRVLWASRVSARFEQGAAPDALAAATLGSLAGANTLSAIRRAASATQALTLFLLSPEFQRR